MPEITDDNIITISEFYKIKQKNGKRQTGGLLISIKGKVKASVGRRWL